MSFLRAAAPEAGAVRVCGARGERREDEGRADVPQRRGVSHSRDVRVIVNQSGCVGLLGLSRGVGVAGASLRCAASKVEIGALLVSVVSAAWARFSWMCRVSSAWRWVSTIV